MIVWVHRRSLLLNADARHVDGCICLGIEVGESFDFDKFAPAIKTALQRVPKGAQELIAWKIPTLARVVNGWSMNTDTMGTGKWNPPPVVRESHAC
jgi:hypothetical protein